MLSAAIQPEAHAGNTVIDLGNLGSGGFRIEGIDTADYSGRSVSGAGDVNGDGLADLIVGAFRAEGDSNWYAGESYVVFGKVSAGSVDLANLGSGGFRIDGFDAGDRSGFSVSGAGDVNGDGLADLIVGALGGDPNGDYDAGESYVVFGKTSADTVDLGALGSGGFRIDGFDAGDRSGFSVSGAGDVNGDGLADLIVGAIGAAPNGDRYAGESYLVFGTASSTPIDLATLGGGFRIDGIDAYDRAGISVSGAGDVNGDGLADLIVGASGANPNGIDDAGESYVVFGKASASAVDLGNLGSGGFRIDGFYWSGHSGFSISGAGDVNGDGLADLIVGAHGADPNDKTDSGESYVVFGKANVNTVDLGNLGGGGFPIDGIDVSDFSGFSVSGAGDVNGDGLADLIVGAFGGDPNGDRDAGESYVVFGKTDTSAVDLGNLGSGGFRIDGIDASDVSGRAVSGAGDVNGDGLADLIVGAYGADPNGGYAAGESYVVFSPQTPALAAEYRARSRNGNPPQTAVGIIGDGSNASHPDARAWIDFADGDDPSGSASIETVTLTRNPGSFPDAATNVHWRVQSTRQNFTAVEVMFRYLDSEITVNEAALGLEFSPNGSAPFTTLNSVVNARNNTVSAVVPQLGFFYLKAVPFRIFRDGFE